MRLPRAHILEPHARLGAKQPGHEPPRHSHDSQDLRGKILAFLSQQQKKAGTRAFAIPYSQTKLASYLSVDRSALSNELSKLRKEGVIDYEGRTYRLL